MSKIKVKIWYNVHLTRDKEGNAALFADDKYKILIPNGITMNLDGYNSSKPKEEKNKETPFIQKFKTLKKQHTVLNAQHRELTKLYNALLDKLKNVNFLKQELIKTQKLLFDLGYIKNEYNEWIKQEQGDK